MEISPQQLKDNLVEWHLAKYEEELRITHMPLKNLLESDNPEDKIKAQEYIRSFGLGNIENYESFIEQQKKKKKSELWLTFRVYQ